MNKMLTENIEVFMNNMQSIRMICVWNQWTQKAPIA